MTTILVSVSGDGTLSPATDGAVPGPSAGGLVTYAIENVPSHASAQDLIDFLSGRKLPGNVFTVDFTQLQAARSSCCGSCG